MKKQDFRKKSDTTLEEFRKTAIRLIKSGRRQAEVAEIIGCSSRTITNWWSSYKTSGAKNLKPKKRGRKDGEKRHLDAWQEKAIQKMITDKCPDQLKLPYALWTRKAVQELIKSQYKIRVAIRTTGDYLQRWGFTPQKPIRRAYEQQPEQVKKWLSEQYPAIKAMAKKENAEIQWCDETGFSSHDNRGRGYSPKGKTPVAYGTGARFSTSMISSIDNMGKLRWMVYEGAMNIDLFISFLRRLIKDSGRKVYLIVDNLRTHHAIKVKEWLSKHMDEIELFFLPAYSPELNPDEYVNHHVKEGVRNKPLPKNKTDLQQNIRSHMRGLQLDKEKVSRFFDHKKVEYAKAS